MKSKTPKIGCIVATLCFVAFFLVFYYEFLSHAQEQPKLGTIKGGEYILLYRLGTYMYLTHSIRIVAVMPELYFLLSYAYQH